MSSQTRKKKCLTTRLIHHSLFSDPAFLDRADLKLHIGLPGVQARYEILRSAVNELMRVKLVTAVSCEVFRLDLLNSVPSI